MIIGGLQKFSLLDYPGAVSAIVFTKGCNFRCHFCYNPMLVWPSGKVDKLKNNSPFALGGEKKDHPSTRLPFRRAKKDDFFSFLKARQGKLDGVVISGGEPTINRDLPEFIKKIKDLGYLVKLDTNGTNSVMLKELINKKLIDYIAMDIKAPEEKYRKVVGVEVDFKKIEKSAKIVKESNLPYEFRTTVVPGLLEKSDIAQIGKIIKGAEKWFLQKFRADTELVDSKFKVKEPFTDEEMKEMVKIGREYVKKCEAR